MKFRVSTSAEALQESSGSSYMNKSGIYDATIQFASLDVTTNGAESVNFNLLYNGETQTVYGPYVTNTSGEVNEIGAKLINKLAIIAGMTEGDDFEMEEETHNVGKDKTPREFTVITNFTDLPIKIRLQEEYTINPKTKEIRKSMVIKNFFNEDGTSAEEIVSGVDAGKRLALETEKYSTNITYKDGLDPESVQAWKDSKKSGTAAPKAKVSAAATKKPAGGSIFK
ncbi:MAG: hypothetical protein ACYDD5_00855 [Sulfuricurvum sp.]